MITFNYGTMNSAKSVNLICKAYELKQKNLKYICLYPKLDTRTDNGFITSRAGLKVLAIPIINKDNLRDILEKFYLLDFSYVLIDEIQFLTKEEIDILLEASINDNMNILCYGLLTDFKTEMFEASKRLVEVADELHHIKSYCNCGNIASVNARIDKKGNIVNEGSKILIGAEDKYITLCKKCYYKKLNN